MAVLGVLTAVAHELQVSRIAASLEALGEIKSARAEYRRALAARRDLVA
jgi:hypothetical protein